LNVANDPGNVKRLAEAIRTLSAKECQELWSLLATLEEREDLGALAALRESEEDVREGRLYTFEEIFG
jgi:hypothetical protein